MRDTCRHVVGVFKFLNFFLAQTRGSRIQRRAKNFLFAYFPSRHTDIEVEQHDICIKYQCSFFCKYFNTLRYFLYSQSVLNSCYVYNESETSKELLASLEMMLTFLSRTRSTPGFTFFWLKVTLPYSSYFCLKIITSIFLKTFGERYYAIFAMKPPIYVKLCLKTEIALFLGKM